MLFGPILAMDANLYHSDFKIRHALLCGLCVGVTGNRSLREISRSYFVCLFGINWLTVRANAQERG